MKASQSAYDLIKQFEGCKLHAYPDPGTGNLPITIGYGSIMRKDGSRFNLGDTITQEEAEELLQWEVDRKAAIIDTMLLKTFVNQNQFDALVSFAYNVGVGALVSSTLYRKITRNPDDPAIGHEFSRWTKANGKELQGLINRRQTEYNLYLT